MSSSDFQNKKNLLESIEKKNFKLALEYTEVNIVYYSI